MARQRLSTLATPLLLTLLATVHGDFVDIGGARVVNLLEAIPIPFPENGQLAFVEGEDGFPAFGFQPGHDVKHPYRLYLPERMPRDFAIAVTVRPTQPEGGFLFAVVNPLETVVQLGVQITPGGPGTTNISLVYTDSEVHFASQRIATFSVPSFETESMIPPGTVLVLPVRG
ncbi:collagen alpha-1(XV) chain-like [Pollicipes pollicipes]|uniref:collagen alpha-1(XV) chain-like n=1 Tax=Pollicipes pollicipes TaxID=41117 RepID=UPI001884CFC5|nr:collagen alpha-1(XV) chain-like [Pollicipes pollicipes]